MDSCLPGCRIILDEEGKPFLATSMALSLRADSPAANRQVTGVAMDILPMGVAQWTGEGALPRARGWAQAYYQDLLRSFAVPSRDNPNIGIIARSPRRMNS